jgi:uncharacterized membrane protein YgdD (TMEM256/DUF423 family)
MMLNTPIARAAAVFAFLGIALGAFGAHGLEERLTALGHAETWKTATLYHLIHALALLWLSTAGLQKGLRAVLIAWVAGITIFSGSLYLLSVTGISWLGAITPIGGVSLMVGWAILIWAAGRAKA